MAWYRSCASAERKDKCKKRQVQPTYHLKGWKSVLLETKNAFSNKNTPILAAGVAYFATLSFFPLLAAAVAIAAFIINQSQLQAVINSLNVYLPSDIASLISTQLTTLTSQDSTNILVAIAAIAISLFSASGATQNIISATNAAYDRHESRGFIKLKLLSFSMTLGALLVGFMIIALLILTEDGLVAVGVPHVIAAVTIYVRWPLIIAIITIILAVFYRYGPDRLNPKWQWVSWGASIASFLWLLGTIVFFIYVQNFGNYSGSYSLFAGIIILMIWLNLSAFIVLLGAEINHRLERRADVPIAANA